MFALVFLAAGALNGISFDVPKAEPADVCVEPGLKSVWIEGEPYRGKPTKFFAYYGLPEGASAADNCAAIPKRVAGTKDDWTASGFGGPRGWGRDDLADEPAGEQWPYHAVATAVRTHSFIRSTAWRRASTCCRIRLSWPSASA